MKTANALGSATRSIIVAATGALLAAGCAPSVTVIGSLGDGGGGGSPGVGPVGPAPGSPVGAGTLAVTEPLVQVVAPHNRNPLSYRLVPDGPDTVALVSSDVDERRFRVEAWPPALVSQRHLFDGRLDAPFAVADNGDFTYALAVKDSAHAMHLTDRISPNDTAALATWAFEPPYSTRAVAIVRASGVTFSASSRKTHTYLARVSGGLVDAPSDPAFCAPLAFGGSIGTIGLGDHFLFAVPGSGDGPCNDSGEPPAEVTVVSAPATGVDTTPTNVASTKLRSHLANGMFVPRDGGAWFVAIEWGAVELFGLASDGAVAFGPTSIDTEVRIDDASGTPAFDAVPTADGGLFLSWSVMHHDGTSQLELARVDKTGALVERGELPATTLDTRYDEVMITPRGTTNILFLRVTHYVDHPTHTQAIWGAVEAMAISDTFGVGH